MNAPLPSAHSKLGASSMYRWAACPGSVRLCASVPPSPPSPYAAEGTKAHEFAAALLKNEPYELPVTQDMRDAVAVYVGHVNAIRTPSDVLLVEQGFHLKELHPDLYGTADCIIWKSYSRHLHVLDYKHGAGIPVDVKGNPQLKYYALGALLASGFNAREVTVHIVQPRCQHPDGAIRSETFDAFELVDWAAELLDAAKRTESPDAPLVDGDHCRFCPAAAICPRLAKRATTMAQREFGVATAPSGVLAAYDPAQLSEALTFAPRVEAWAKSVREFAYAEALRGRTPPGYKLVAKRAVRSWIPPDPAAHLRALGLTDDQIFETPSVKSPPQIETLVGKKGFSEIEKTLVKKVSSGNTLAPIDDARPEVRILDAAAEFAAVALPGATASPFV